MKYLNLKKTTAVVLSIGMVFSSSAVTGFAADNSKKIPTIPNSYINKVAEDIDMMEHMLMIGGIHVRAGSLERHIQSSQLNFCYGHLRQHM